MIGMSISGVLVYCSIHSANTNEVNELAKTRIFIVSKITVMN